MATNRGKPDAWDELCGLAWLAAWYVIGAVSVIVIALGLLFAAGFWLVANGG